ncbi:MAG TPA: response regulator [Candidatus Sulfotelmatobacter sp.]|nr:response regulator [Candidatus Sulfotelmatobacter sp.]
MTDAPSVDVLLAEDNPYDAELLIRAIRQSELVRGVHWVRDGIQALDFLRCRGEHAGRDPRQRPRLVLLDLKMPKVDGLDVLRALKADADFVVPIVMITSSGEERDVVESYALGVNSFVVKPVDGFELTRAIRTLCTYWLALNRVPEG